MIKPAASGGSQWPSLLGAVALEQVEADTKQAEIHLAEILQVHAWILGLDDPTQVELDRMVSGVAALGNTRSEQLQLEQQRLSDATGVLELLAEDDPDRPAALRLVAAVLDSIAVAVRAVAAVDDVAALVSERAGQR